MHPCDHVAMTETQPRALADPAGSDAPDLDYAGRTPYVAYTEADVLVGLVHPKTDEPLEVTFIVVTQIMELHFTLLRHEWRLAIRSLLADDLPAALAALRRSVTVQNSLLNSWDMLAPMSPAQYNRFRGSLGKASGFQSFGYRELEFLIGAKNPRMLNPHSGMPAVHAELQAAFDEPSLYDAAVRLLAGRGLPIPAELLRRDVREPWTESDPAVVEAWRRVYTDNDGENELAELAEVLTAVAERHSRWRYVHYVAVQRILGAKPGTGGSAGLAWLKRTVDTPLFPELWEVRSVL